MSSKKATQTKSMLKVNEYTLVQFDEDALRSIIRDEINRAIALNIDISNVYNDNLKRVESKIDKLIWNWC